MVRVYFIHKFIRWCKVKKIILGYVCLQDFHKAYALKSLMEIDVSRWHIPNIMENDVSVYWWCILYIA